MPRSCWPGQRREPALVRAPSARPQAPGNAHILPNSDPCCLPPELEFAKSIMKIAEAGKVSIHQQVAMTRPLPRGLSLQNPSPEPLDPQHPPMPTLPPPPPPQNHMPLQYIYTLFLEHDLSLGALAMETVAQQKRDYYQVRGPCCPNYPIHTSPGGRHLASVPFY